MTSSLLGDVLATAILRYGFLSLGNASLARRFRGTLGRPGRLADTCGLAAHPSEWFMLAKRTSKKRKTLRRKPTPAAAAKKLRKSLRRLAEDSLSALSSTVKSARRSVGR
jgi:hypothetical protein